MIPAAALLLAAVVATPGPVARVARDLSSTRAEARRAALAEAPLLDGAWALLPAILALDTPEAARAAARIAHRLRDPLVVETLEVDPDVVDAARRDCADGAIAQRPPAQRADLLACAVDLGATVPTALLFDEAPEVRAAALSLVLVAAEPGWRDEIRRAADGDDARRPLALAALCAGDARATARELDGPGRARLRELALSPSTDAVTAERLAMCLRASPDAKDRAAAKKRVRRP